MRSKRSPRSSRGASRHKFHLAEKVRCQCGWNGVASDQESGDPLVQTRGSTLLVRVEM